MRRKLVKHGPSSLTLSLPMKWIKEHNFKSGDEIDVIEQGKDLIISGNGKKELREITIHLTDSKQLIKRVFVMPYVRGYDIINVMYDSPSVLEFIQTKIDMLFGFEIIEQTSKCCKLKNVAETRAEEFDAMLLRMFNICLTMLEELLAFVEKKDLSALQRLTLLERTITRIDLLCRRVINTGGGGIELRKAGSMYALVRILEEMGDIANDVGVNMTDLKIVHKKEFMKVINYLIDGFDLLKKIKYKGDIDLLYVYKNVEIKLREVWGVEKKLTLPEIRFFFLLKQISYKLHDLSEEVILWSSVK